jgi:hypothetical protein
VIPPRVSVGQDPKEKEPGKPDPSGFSRKSWAETALAAPTAAAETATHAVTVAVAVMVPVIWRALFFRCELVHTRLLEVDHECWMDIVSGYWGKLPSRHRGKFPLRSTGDQPPPHRFRGRLLRFLNIGYRFERMGVNSNRMTSGFHPTSCRVPSSRSAGFEPDFKGGPTAAHSQREAKDGLHRLQHPPGHPGR